MRLQILATAGLATTYFVGLALATPYISFLDLSADVSLAVYSLPILVGLLVSGRFWGDYVSTFHAVTRQVALAVSARQILLVALMIFGLIVATKDRSVSRLFLAFYLVTCAGLLVVINRYLPRLLARFVFRGSQRLKTLLVGPRKLQERLGPWLRQQNNLGMVVAGVLSEDVPPEGTAQRGFWLGRPADFLAVLREREIGLVVLLGSSGRAETVLEIVEGCQAAGVRLLIYQDYADAAPIPMIPVVDAQHIFLTMHEEPLADPVNRWLKRALDIVVALPVVVLILPPLSLIVWVLQARQAPGPLLFRRNRGGAGGREFAMLKYRSMRTAEPDENLEARQARRGDARIYPFGHVLRKYSLDEFPQFLNVLWGEMSLVGPRPHLPAHDREFSLVAKTYRTRQLVKPGITGLAQVSGFRGEIDDAEMLHQRVQLDVTYITTWSFWLDVSIILRTTGQVVAPPKSAR